MNRKKNCPNTVEVWPRTSGIGGAFTRPPVHCRILPSDREGPDPSDTLRRLPASAAGSTNMQTARKVAFEPVFTGLGTAGRQWYLETWEVWKKMNFSVHFLVRITKCHDVHFRREAPPPLLSVQASKTAFYRMISIRKRTPRVRTDACLHTLAARDLKPSAVIGRSKLEEEKDQIQKGQFSRDVVTRCNLPVFLICLDVTRSWHVTG